MKKWSTTPAVVRPETDKGKLTPMEAGEKQGGWPDLRHMEMTAENITRPFKDWAVASAEHFFPKVGARTYRVPAFHFNHLNLLTVEQALKKKLVSLPIPSLPGQLEEGPPSSSSASASSSSSMASSASTSPFPCMSATYRQGAARLHEDVEMVSGENVPHYSCESVQDSAAVVDSREKPLVHVTEWDGSSKKRHLFTNSAAEYKQEEFNPNDAVLSPTSSSSSACYDSESYPVYISAESKTVPSVVMDCTANMHISDETCRDVTIQEQTVNNGHTNQPQAKVPTTKRRGKRRRNVNLKHSKNSEKSLDAEVRDSSADTHQHEQSNFSVSIYRQPVISDSEDEEEPTEKKERTAGSSPPIVDPSQKNSSSSTHSSDHRGSPLPSRKATQKLKRRSCRNPKGHTQPVQVMFPSQESMQRRDKAMSIVLDGFQAVGQALEAGGQEGLFIVSGVNYDHYLCRLPAALLVGRGQGYLGDSPTCRGILDILILQPHAGIVVVQVKSVGGNLDDWQADEQDTVQAVRTVTAKVAVRGHGLRTHLARELIGGGHNSAAGGRSAAGGGDDDDGGGGGGGGGSGAGDGDEGGGRGGKRGREDASTQMQGPADADAVTDADAVLHVLALPFIPRAIYDKTVKDRGQSPPLNSSGKSSRSSSSPAMHVLCKEDFEAPTQSGGSFAPFFADLPGCGVVTPDSAAASPLLEWWTRTFGHRQPRLHLQQLKESVGRLCGHFSTSAAQPDTKCRGEIRTFGHCISEAANRCSAPCLTQGQFDLLNSPDPHVALCGPPGSGKSLLLTLKAVQWLEQGEDGQDHVVVASLGHKMASSPRDQLLQNAIYSRKTESRKTGELLRAVFPVEDMVPEDVELEVAHVLNSLLTCVSDARSSEVQTDGKMDLTDCQMMKAGQNTSPDKFHIVVNDVDSNDEKTLLVLHALRRHPLVRSVWWSTTEPPRSQDMTSHFRVETLAHVTRRTLHVQRVMKAVEWRRGWATAYAADSVESALPTEGPPVIWLQHRHHRPDLWKGHVGEMASLSNHCHQKPSEIPLETIVADDESFNAPWSVNEKTDREHDMDLDHNFAPNLSCAGSTGNVSWPNHQHQNTEYAQSNHKKELSGYSKFKDDEIKPVVSLNFKSKSDYPKTNSSDSAFKKGGTCFSDRFHSPFWCDSCSEATANMISQLVIDSINPNVPPFSVGSTKLLKEPAKNRYGEAIKPRDILILADCMSRNDRTSEAGDEGKPWLEDLVHSPFVLRIQEVMPLKVLSEESSKRIAFPSNFAVLTDTSCARGLERKVVIYVPWNTGKAHTCDENLQNVTRLTPNYHHNQEPPRVPAQTDLGQASHDKGKYNRGSKDGQLMQNSAHQPMNTAEIYLQEVNGHSDTPDSMSAEEDDLLSSLCCETEESCPVCDEAGKQAATKQGFTRCGQDANSNTLILAESQHDSVPRPDCREHPHSCGNVFMKTVCSSENMHNRRNQSLNNVTDLGEGGECQIRLSRGHSCGPFTANSRRGTDPHEVTGRSVDLNNEADVKHPSVPNVLSFGNEDKSIESVNLGSNGLAMPDLVTSSQQDQQYNEQAQETKPLGSSTSKEQQLPSWIKAKENLTCQRYLRCKIPQNMELGILSRDGFGASTSTQMAYRDVLIHGCKSQNPESLLEGLSDVSRRGIFAAAACCVAQLVIILP